MNFRIFIILLCLLPSLPSYAFIERDSLSIDPRWSTWIPNEISSDGNWLFAEKVFGNRKQPNESYIVNTQTGQRVPLEFGASRILLDQNRILVNQVPKWEWELVNLLNPTERTVLKEVKSIEDVPSLKRYLCFTNNNELQMYDYTKKVPQLIWNTTAVQEYAFNPSKTTLIYRKGEKISDLYVLDLRSLQEKKLLTQFEGLTNFRWIWNRDETALAVMLKDQRILFVDLITAKTKAIELPPSEEARTNPSFKFFDNNDLYIQYQISSGIVNEDKGLVDVWNGNARDLHLKNSWWLYYDVTRSDILKTFVYSQENNHFNELERNRNKEYFHIGIPNYILSYDPFEKDPNMEVPIIGLTLRYTLEQIEPHKVLGELTTAFQLDYFLNRSPKGTAMVYPKGDFWELYDFETHQRTTIPQKLSNDHVLWSSDSKSLFFNDGQNFVQYDIASKKTKALTDFQESEYLFLRFSGYINKGQSYYIDIEKPLTLNIRHQDFGYSLYSFYKNKLTKIVDHSPNKITVMSSTSFGKASQLVWTEQNFTQPHTVMASLNGKTKTILASDIPKELYSWEKQKLISFTDKYGKKLNGILYYPKDFDATKKYPMVVNIYEGLGFMRNTFDVMSLYNPFGFNISLLNAQGYFVFLPDTYVSDEGPGLSAVECVTKGIEAITAEEPAINSKKIGIIGQSFAGYKTAFIVSQTNLFAAAISCSGAHDLVNFYYEYSYSRNSPGWYMFEKSQYGIKTSFGENPQKYLRNSTINYAHQIKTPLLLSACLDDTNVPWEHTRHLYVALKRYQLPTIAFFYKNEVHSLDGIEAQEHFTYKTMDWFDYYLKDNKNIPWITNGVDYSTYSY